MKFLVVFCAVFLVCAALDAEKEKVGKKAVKLLAKKCQDSSGASEDDMENLAEGSLPITPEGKCLLACFSKEFSLIKEDGSLSQKSFAMIADFIMEKENDEAKAAVKELGVTCQGPFDKEDDCENSYLIFKCFDDEKDKIKNLYQSQ